MPKRLLTYPWMWVFNDESPATCRRYCERAGVRYKIDKPIDGVLRSERGLYVHGDDLLKLRRYFRSFGMLSESSWVWNARVDYRAMLDGSKPKGQRT